MAYNKIIYGNTTLIDLTSDTVTADKLLTGVTAHNRAGEQITGTCDYDADTSDATATADEILAGETAYVNGSKVTGTMPNRGGQSGTISDLNTPYDIPLGFHDGTGTVSIDQTEAQKINPNNIKDGVSILGVTGTYTGEGVTFQQKTVDPYTTQQVVTADAGYDGLSQVTVNAIYYNETPNAAGGMTVTIGMEAP